MLLGGKGNISVTANVAPNAMSALCTAAIAGDAIRSRAIHRELLPLHKALFVESNPIPVKWALEKMGKIGPGIRLPLTRLSEAQHTVVESAMAIVGIV
jgi:4-hydroxy-tetrahydrodipicolinate synthase